MMQSSSRLAPGQASRGLVCFKNAFPFMKSRGRCLLHEKMSLIQRRSFFRFVREYEKGVTFTLGKLTAVKEPGLRMKLPFFQTMWRVDMRTSFNRLKPQKVITRDQVVLQVDGVVQFRIVDPKKALCHLIEGVEEAVKELAQLKIQEELSQSEMSVLFHQREQVAKKLLEGTRELIGDSGIELQSIRIKSETAKRETTKTFFLIHP